MLGATTPGSFSSLEESFLEARRCVLIELGGRAPGHPATDTPTTNTPNGGKGRWRGRRQEQHADSPPPVSSHLVAVLATLALGSQVGLAAQSSQNDRKLRRLVGSVEVTATDGSSVTIAWEPSRDNEASPGTGSMSTAPGLGRRHRRT